MTDVNGKAEKMKTVKRAETTVSKLQIGGDDYYLMTVWSDALRMTLVKNDRSWSGEYGPADMEPYRESLEMSSDEYVEHVREALSGGRFSFDFSPDSKTLCWKKSAERISFVHGKVTLGTISESDGAGPLVDALLDAKREGEERLSVVEAELADTHSQLADAVIRLQKSTDAKIAMEHDIYTKFLAILNSKKRRIASLEEFITANHSATDGGENLKALEMDQSD